MPLPPEKERSKPVNSCEVFEVLVWMISTGLYDFDITYENEVWTVNHALACESCHHRLIRLVHKLHIEQAVCPQLARLTRKVVGLS